MHTKSVPNKGFTEFDARIHTLGIGLSRSRAPQPRNYTCSTYGGMTSIDQHLHTVQTAGMAHNRGAHTVQEPPGAVGRTAGP